MTTKTENELLEDIDRYKVELVQYENQLPKLTDEFDISSLEKKIRITNNHIKSAERELSYITNGPVTKASIKALQEYLAELIRALGSNNTLSPKQATGSLYGRIMSDLKRVYELRHNMYHSPEADYDYQQGSQSNNKNKDLQLLLQKAQEELLSTRNFNYISLRDFVDDLNSQIKALK